MAWELRGTVTPFPPRPPSSASQLQSGSCLFLTSVQHKFPGGFSILGAPSFPSPAPGPSAAAPDRCGERAAPTALAGRPQLTQQALQEEFSPQPGHGRDAEQRFLSRQHAPGPPPRPRERGPRARPLAQPAATRPPAASAPRRALARVGPPRVRPRAPHPAQPARARATCAVPRPAASGPATAPGMLTGGLGPRRRAKPWASGPAAEQPGEGACRRPGGRDAAQRRV